MKRIFLKRSRPLVADVAAGRPPQSGCGFAETFIKASDVIRGGVALECWRRYEHEDRVLVAEAFWYDDTGKFTIEIPEGALLFVLVEAFLRDESRAGEASDLEVEDPPGGGRG